MALLFQGTSCQSHVSPTHNLSASHNARHDNPWALLSGGVTGGGQNKDDLAEQNLISTNIIPRALQQKLNQTKG